MEVFRVLNHTRVKVKISYDIITDRSELCPPMRNISKFSSAYRMANLCRSLHADIGNIKISRVVTYLDTSFSKFCTHTIIFGTTGSYKKEFHLKNNKDVLLCV